MALGFGQRPLVYSGCVNQRPGEAAAVILACVWHEALQEAGPQAQRLGARSLKAFEDHHGRRRQPRSACEAMKCVYNGELALQYLIFGSLGEVHGFGPPSTISCGFDSLFWLALGRYSDMHRKRRTERFHSRADRPPPEIRTVFLEFWFDEAL